MIHQSLLRRLPRFALAVALLLTAGFVAAQAAHADVVLTSDGQWWPKKIRDEMVGKDSPPDSVLRASGKNNLDLEYDTVKIGGASLSAANVVEVWCTAAYANAHFNNGETQGASAYWPEAAASFAEAAENLKGSAKQVAMWKQVQCLRNSNNAQKTFDAAQQLLEAFPKAYYLAPVHMLRARVLYIRGKKADAKKALETVITTQRMNARDYFEAKISMVYLFEFKTAGKDKAKYGKARAAYQQILSEIDTRTGARTEASTQRLKALVGIGKCYVYEEKYKEARKFFDQVIADDESLKSTELLAQAYTGLGDVKYALVKKTLSAKPDPAKLPELQEKLTDAALDYLRVAKHYVAEAGDEVYPATVGVARVWATQFHLGGDKDCPLAMRASKFFYAAHKLLGRGEQQRLLTKEIKAFLEKRNDACTVPGADKK